MNEMSFRKLTVVWIGLAFLSLGCQSGLVQSPNLFRQGQERDRAFARVAERDQIPAVDLIYVTDRVARPQKDGTVSYGDGRSHAIEYGICRVNIGKPGLSWPNLVQASINPIRPDNIPVRYAGVTQKGAFPASDTPTIRQGDEWVDPPDFLAEQNRAQAGLQQLIADRLAHAEHKEVVIFVHGFNNTFEEVAERLAQLWHYTGRQGVPILYSWPSTAAGLQLLFGYNHDRESSEFTVHHLKQTIRAVNGVSGLEHFHLVAHSRGTDVAISASRELYLEERHHWDQKAKPIRMKHLVLIAGDVDIEVVNQRMTAERAWRICDDLTIYSSPDDLALRLSSWLFSSVERLGQLTWSVFSPIQKKNMEMTQDRVAIIQVDVISDPLGHAYFLDSPAVLSDLVLLLRDGRKPGAEHGRPLDPVAPGFWRLTNAYPVLDRQ